MKTNHRRKRAKKRQDHSPNYYGRVADYKRDTHRAFRRWPIPDPNGDTNPPPPPRLDWWWYD